MIKALTYACTHARSQTIKKYVEQVQISFNWGCRDGLHHAKNRGNKVIPLAILSRILAQSCVTPPYIIHAKGVTHDCASILDSIAKGITLFPRFFALNDFFTCIRWTAPGAWHGGMHHAKNRGHKVIPLAILSRILAQSCVTPPYIIKISRRHS